MQNIKCIVNIYLFQIFFIPYHTKYILIKSPLSFEWTVPNSKQGISLTKTAASGLKGSDQTYND
jgi:hypothetical protein